MTVISAWKAVASTWCISLTEIHPSWTAGFGTICSGDGTASDGEVKGAAPKRSPAFTRFLDDGVFTPVSSLHDG
jgi:hypothetical protein